MVKEQINSFDITISSYCQAFCAGCQRNDEDGTPSDWITKNQFHMDPSNFKKFLDSGYNKWQQFGNLQLCGELGDPMMHPRIDEILDIAFDYNLINGVLINTNGGIRRPEWYAAQAKKNRNLTIAFGIDGINHEMNWKYRKGVKFQQAWDNMIAFHENGGRVEWHYILFNWNYKTIPEVVNIAKDLKLEKKQLVFKITRTDNPAEGLCDKLIIDEATSLLEEYGYV